MFKNHLKEKIRNGQPALGTWIGLRDPLALEAMAQTGFDWWVIDTEHCPMGSDSLIHALAALKGTQTTPMVRLMSNHPDYFKAALDLGAEGVIVPMIQSAEDARRAVDSCRYPPQGLRGFGPLRASRYFLDLAEYCRHANDEILLVAQIESLQAVRELDAIMGVKGIDGLFIGPGDLSASMNRIGESQAAEVQEVVHQIMAKARTAGMPFGTIAASPEELVQHVERGATLVTVSGDLLFLLQGGFDAVRRSRSLLEDRARRKDSIA